MQTNATTNSERYKLMSNSIPFIINFNTVKPAFFACPLFRKFHDHGNFAKIMCCKYSKSHATFSVILSSASKNYKINGAKII